MQIGSWARAGGVVGIVSKVDADGSITIFNPGDRQMIKAPPGMVQALPTGQVEARVALRLEVPHGLQPDSLKRWLAALIDPVLRAHAQAQLIEHGLDDGPFMIAPTVDIREVKD